MRVRFPAAHFADALCALVMLAAIAVGSFAIALTTWRTMVAFNTESELAPTYRPGDNPWTYAAWWSARDISVPQNSSNYVANVAGKLTRR